MTPIRVALLVGLTILALTGSSGCALVIQNRYSVFGFDGLQTQSASEAKAWSALLLLAVALVSMTIGAIAFWLIQRWRRDSPQPEREKIAAGPEPIELDLSKVEKAVAESRSDAPAPVWTTTTAPR